MEDHVFSSDASVSETTVTLDYIEISERRLWKESNGVVVRLMKSKLSIGVFQKINNRCY